jgi:hypothetical protein
MDLGFQRGDGFLRSHLLIPLMLLDKKILLDKHPLQKKRPNPYLLKNWVVFSTIF